MKIISWNAAGLRACRSKGIEDFIVDEGFMSSVKDSLIFSEVMGSDHCPIGLIIE